MNKQFEKNAGIALILFTILMVFTMLLHPAGGSFEYLLKISGIIVISHTIAIVSIPFAAIGFWGLTRKLGTDNFFSISAFAIVLFGLVAVMIAAVTNGLVLPVFIQKYRDASPELITAIKPILKYNSAVNTAFDYIYTGAFCLSMLFWSIAIWYTRKLSLWLAYFGTGLSVLAAILFASGFPLHDLQGFRIFVSSIVLWIVMAGIALVRTARE